MGRKPKPPVITGEYHVTVCATGHNHIGLPPQSEGELFTERALAPDDAYDFAQAILRCYDYAVGI